MWDRIAVATRCNEVPRGRSGEFDDPFLQRNVCRDDPARTEGQKPQEPGNRIGDADMMRRLCRGRVVRPENLQREIDEPCRG